MWVWCGGCVGFSVTFLAYVAAVWSSLALNISEILTWMLIRYAESSSVSNGILLPQVEPCPRRLI